MSYETSIKRKITSMKFNFLIIFSSLFFNYFSQNLIYNGGFELYKNCPNGYSEIEKALGWKMPSEGTSDYFNSCSKSNISSVPKNIGGYSLPYEGNAYAGFGIFLDRGISYEFIQTKLNTNLNNNQKYCISFFLKLANSSNYKFDEFSILLSKDSIKVNQKEFYDKSIEEKNNFRTYKLPLSQKSEWTKVCVIIIPKVEEQFLTIGFNKIKETDKLNRLIKKESYYYIDDVSLVEIRDSSECACNEEKSIKKDSVKVEIVKSYYDSADVKAFVLNNLVFESNKSKLMPASNAELDKLVNYLKTNPTKTIELFGYTDNTGKELDNVKLSEARVKSVADYLINKGIESKRITFKGYGSKNPIKPNDTEFNKAKNRRVEFKIN